MAPADPSGSLASPSSLLDLVTPTERIKTESSLQTPVDPLTPHATVGRFSYAPATQTTVVTTTTTTTTSFPPLVLKAPRHLNELDPKLYPLAATPTPSILKHVRFDCGGTPTYFREADDAPETFSEIQRQNAALHASNGVLRTVTNLPPQFENTPPASTSTSQTVSQKPLRARVSPQASMRSRKRPASPVSISEAAELARQQRHGHKRRIISGKAVSSTAENSRPPRELPTLRGEASSAGLSVSSSEKSTQLSFDPSVGHPLASSARVGEAETPYTTLAPRRENSTPLSPHPAPSKNVSFAAADELPVTTEDQTAERHNDGSDIDSNATVAGNGAAATPPIADTDLQPVDPNPAPTLLNRPTVPSHLDLSASQDVSLPSPSLSPVTAALNHGHAAVGFDAEVDDDVESNFELSPPRNGQSTTTDRRLRSSASIPPTADGVGNALRRPAEAEFTNAQLPSPTLMEIPSMLDSFDAMPAEMQTYLMYQFLRRCAKPTLQFVAGVVNPALKCDFLCLLPLELSLNIIRLLDYRSLCRASQVSRKWRQMIDSDEQGWKELLDRDRYDLPEGEVQRAIKEGWGWQIPHGEMAGESDIGGAAAQSPLDDSSAPMTRSGSSTSRASFVSEATVEGEACPTPQSGRPKRKAAAKFNSRKQARRRERPRDATEESGTDNHMSQLAVAEGPYTAASAAAVAVPYPTVGLPSLKNLHLYKSLYARQHAIRKHWMMARIKPRHIAFRAHDRHVVTCLQFDTDKILSGSDDAHINVFDTQTGALRKRLWGHEGGVWALQYEGNVLVSGSTDRTVRVWDIEQGYCTQVFYGHTSTVRCLQILMPAKVGQDVNGRAIMAPVRPLIITGSRDSTLRVWKLPQPGDPSYRPMVPPTPEAVDCPYFVRTLAGHSHSVRAIAAHGDTLVSGSYDCTVRVWKITTGETVWRLQGHTQKVYSVVLDHERNRCISGSMDNLVKVWSLDTGNVIHNLEGHTSLVGLLDLNHDVLVSAAADMTLRIWDHENGKCKSILAAHTGAITCFQHDSEKVISGSDRTLKMWDAKTGDYVRNLLTNLSGVWQVKFNGRRCVAAVQRNNLTYIEVLDFGAMRDGIPEESRGHRIVVNTRGEVMSEGVEGAEVPVMRPEEPTVE